jgi:DNA-binding transcriptional ArsR family regulator
MQLSIKKDKEKIKLIGEALRNTTRLEMLKFINGVNSHQQIAEHIKIKTSSVTYHLDLLKRSDLVTEEDGKGSLGRKNKIPKLINKEIVIKL